ncbi:FAD binding domain-containing protein [Mycobacterium sp. 21AC1]|uniref:FAD binding domain-containing protein n=1 Tax=[Mycobacterium] appelbergii TaxID=2939269 RepID=UPI002938D02B|nr:FAD binding domain-containing protein [Mycobacterium sp. 21AC1]MDV3126155.1 FAD binding domain-containing protein [Mycobacterium sp. 21AC1]
MLTGIHVPENPESAAGLVMAGGLPLGGGTSLMPRLNDHASPPTELVSLRHAGLDSVRIDGQTVALGAAVTLSAIERNPDLSVLHQVVRTIAAPPVRSLATVAGNLFAPQPYGDLAVALLALDAELDFADRDGFRTGSLENFLADDHDHALITQIRFRRPQGSSFRYLKAARRRLNSGSVATIAATIELEDQRIAAIRVALGGLAPRVIRAHAVEGALRGRRLDADSVETACREGLDDLDPADDAYASAWYRRRVFPVHLRRALLGV